ncbi:MAG: Crp/Fnr family transcriptional regulator [Desulfobacteraceae bacterium]
MMRHPTAPPPGECEKRDLLRRCPVFQDLEELEFAGIEPCIELHAFAKGQTIFSQSSPCTDFLIVADGLVKVSIGSASGKQVTYLLAEDGEPINLIGPFTGQPRLLAAYALSNAHVASIPQHPFLSFVYEHPKVIPNIMRILGQAIDSANGRIIDMLEKPVDMRVKKVLHTLYRKFGNPVPFTSFELADLAGTTPESALRAMAGLRQAGVVRSRRGEVFIQDVSGLQEACEETLWV